MRITYLIWRWDKNRNVEILYFGRRGESYGSLVTAVRASKFDPREMRIMPLSVMRLSRELREALKKYMQTHPASVPLPVKYGREWWLMQQAVTEGVRHILNTLEVSV